MKNNDTQEKKFERFIDWVNGDLEGEKKVAPVEKRVYKSDAGKHVLVSKLADKWYQIFSVLVTVSIMAILLFTVPNSPEYGNPDNPAMNEVSLRYVEKGPLETGAVNAVAGMILDYRAFDTLGEALVLFTAAIGVVSLLNIVKKEDHND